MKKIFICSPYQGNTDCSAGIAGHLELARKLCRDIMRDDVMPIAPHLLFPQFMDDNNPIERAAGCLYSTTLLRLCDAIYVYDGCCGISKGMQAEIDEAEKMGIGVYTLPPYGN